MYVNFYTNPKTILKDIVKEIVSNDERPEHRWTLEYPVAQTKAKAVNLIEHRRRAVISTVIQQESKWNKNEKLTLTQEIFNGNEDYLIFPLNEKLSSGAQLRLRNSKNTYLYRSRELEDLDGMEFYVDEASNSVYISKQGITYDNNLYFIANYESVSFAAQKWYVSFFYPDNVGVPEEEKNRSYFCWQFGKEIDENYQIVPNKMFSCPYSTAYWAHTDMKKYPIGDWLPINVYLTFDTKSISFILCGDPVYSEEIIHGFGYIGALDGIKGALNDDFNSNFGSCGNLLSSGRVDIISLTDSGVIEDRPLDTRRDLRVIITKEGYNDDGLLVKHTLYHDLVKGVEVLYEEELYESLVTVDTNELISDYGIEIYNDEAPSANPSYIMNYTFTNGGNILEWRYDFIYVNPIID